MCALVQAGFGLVASARGSVSADVWVHVPRLPALCISPTAWKGEIEATARPNLAPLSLRTGSPSSTFGGPLFHIRWQTEIWPTAFPSPSLTVTNCAPDGAERLTAATRTPFAPLANSTSSFQRPILALLKRAEDYAAMNPAQSPPILAIRSSTPPGLARQPVAMRTRAIAGDSAQPRLGRVPEYRIVLQATPGEIARALDQRLVAGVLDEAGQRGSATGLDDALKRELLSVMANDASPENSYRAFLALLADAAGTNDLHRGQTLLAWTERAGTSHDVDRLVYFTALHLYRTLEYDAALGLINRFLATPGKAGRDDRDQFMMLKALCAWGEGNDGASAIEVVNAMLTDHPDSPLVPHALFLRAWVHLYCGRTGEARTGFKEVISRHPQSEYAARAAQMLTGLPADE